MHSESETFGDEAIVGASSLVPSIEGAHAKSDPGVCVGVVVYYICTTFVLHGVLHLYYMVYYMVYYICTTWCITLCY